MSEIELEDTGRSMYMEVDRTKELAQEFKDKITELETEYNELIEKYKEIDGSNENWQGDSQKKFYDYYCTQVSNKFPGNIEKFKEYHEFLVNTINDYVQRNQDISDDLDKNEENFDV
jgi:uncharacterized protein YukE